MVSSLNVAHETECRRRACHALVDNPTGGHLVSNSNQFVTKERLFSEDGVLRAIDDLVTLDTATNLLIPCESCHLLVTIDNRDTEMPLLPGHVVHPHTGRVVPIAGSVALDPISQRLVFTTDIIEASQVPVQEELIPFIPYPRDPDTLEPLETGLVPLARRSDMRIGAMFQDPNSGQYVPLCAVTIHPTTNTLLPVGGVHLDPIIGLDVPIHRGCIMAVSTAAGGQDEDGNSHAGQDSLTIAPIISVAFDRYGKVSAVIPSVNPFPHSFIRLYVCLVRCSTYISTPVSVCGMTQTQYHTGS